MKGIEYLERQDKLLCADLWQFFDHPASALAVWWNTVCSLRWRYWSCFEIPLSGDGLFSQR